jgi:hypothetical protein
MSLRLRKGIAMKSMTIQLSIVLLFVIATGCARRDWIESMLVTVDVTGTWSGEVKQVRGTVRGRAELTLEQVGPNVKGLMTLTSPIQAANRRDMPVEGNVNGDVVRLSGIDGNLELVVKGEEMSGAWTGIREWTVELRRRPQDRQPSP